MGTTVTLRLTRPHYTRAHAPGRVSTRTRTTAIPHAARTHVHTRAAVCTRTACAHKKRSTRVSPLPHAYVRTHPHRDTLGARTRRQYARHTQSVDTVGRTSARRSKEFMSRPSRYTRDFANALLRARQRAIAARAGLAGDRTDCYQVRRHNLGPIWVARPPLIGDHSRERNTHTESRDINTEIALQSTV